MSDELAGSKPGLVGRQVRCQFARLCRRPKVFDPQNRNVILVSLTRIRLLPTKFFAIFADYFHESVFFQQANVLAHDLLY
jgi:hypothetical protein